MENADENIFVRYFLFRQEDNRTLICGCKYINSNKLKNMSYFSFFREGLFLQRKIVLYQKDLIINGYKLALDVEVGHRTEDITWRCVNELAKKIKLR